MITGSFPPMKCGVGDYTYHLVKALAARQDIQIAVLTSLSPESCEDPFDVDVFRVMSNWSILNVRNLSVFLRCVSGFSPDIIHFQYPTQGYNGRLAKILPLMLRFLGFPVVQTWHEHFSEYGLVGRLCLFGCRSLVYVRSDFIDRLSPSVKKHLDAKLTMHIPNASTIPVKTLSENQKKELKEEIAGCKPIICFFGFAYSNKGLEQLFEIADPACHHLVLICDLSGNDLYQATILKLVHQHPWAGHVTVTGFQSSDRVGEILAVADAVIFPFPAGAGEWNTSLKAAEATGVFIIATTQDVRKYGYHEERNVFLAGCNDVMSMREALIKYLGYRIPSSSHDEWSSIAHAHEQIYQGILVSS